jgi:hypothetical protein
MTRKGIASREQLAGLYTELLATPVQRERDAIILALANQLPSGVQLAGSPAGIYTREDMLGFYSRLGAADGDVARDRVVDELGNQLPASAGDGWDTPGLHDEGHQHARPDGSTYVHAHAHIHEHDGERNEPTHDTPDHADAHDTLGLAPVRVAQNLLPGGGTGHDAGQLASDYTPSGSAYELALSSGALAGIDAALSDQMQTAAVSAQLDAANAESDRQMASRGHRLSDEARLSRNVTRAQLGLFTAEPSAQDWENAVIAEAGADLEDVTPDDMAAFAEAGGMRSIASQLLAAGGPANRRTRRYGDPDADDRDAAIEGMMPDVGGLSGYLKGLSW